MQSKSNFQEGSIELTNIIFMFIKIVFKSFKSLSKMEIYKKKGGKTSSLIPSAGGLHREETGIYPFRLSIQRCVWLRVSPDESSLVTQPQ